MGARDWNALANDPEFIALVRARRRFVIPSTIFFLLFYLALPVGIVVAPAFMARPVYGPLTLAYAYGIAQFVMAWVLLAVYQHEASTFDARAQALALRSTDEGNA
jgi:uncharacterized membrane protein (DUF485 family)